MTDYSETQHTVWPTFDSCPVVLTNGRCLWCSECDWSAEQGSLFDNIEPTDTDLKDALASAEGSRDE